MWVKKWMHPIKEASTFIFFGLIRACVYNNLKTWAIPHKVIYPIQS